MVLWKRNKILPNKAEIDLNVNLKINKQIEKDDTRKDELLDIQVKLADVFTI